MEIIRILDSSLKDVPFSLYLESLRPGSPSQNPPKNRQTRTKRNNFLSEKFKKLFRLWLLLLYGAALLMFIRLSVKLAQKFINIRHKNYFCMSIGDRRPETEHWKPKKPEIRIYFRVVLGLGLPDQKVSEGTTTHKINLPIMGKLKSRLMIMRFSSSDDTHNINKRTTPYFLTTSEFRYFVGIAQK